MRSTRYTVGLVLGAGGLLTWALLGWTLGGGWQSVSSDPAFEAPKPFPGRATTGPVVGEDVNAGGTRSVVVTRPPVLRSIADLAVRRVNWIKANHGANLTYLMGKINKDDAVGEGLAGEVAYLKLMRDISIVVAQLDLLERCDVALTNHEPPVRPDHLRVQEFCFLNNVGVTSGGKQIERARLIYDLDMSRYGDIRALEEKINTLEHASAVEDAYRFNALDDQERARVVAQFKEHWKMHIGARQEAEKLDKQGANYHAEWMEVWGRAQSERAICESLIPFSISVNHRTLLASAAK